MKLKDWMLQAGTNDAELARRGGWSKMQVGRWRKGAARPWPENMAALTRLTGGAVTANDFHGDHASEPSAGNVSLSQRQSSGDGDASPAAVAGAGVAGEPFLGVSSLDHCAAAGPQEANQPAAVFSGELAA